MNQPPLGLIVSMALRLDHGLFTELSRPLAYRETPEEMARRQEFALGDAIKCWEEMSGNGFWSEALNEGYENVLTPRLRRYLETHLPKKR